MANWDLTPATAAFLAGDELPMPEAWRARPDFADPVDAAGDPIAPPEINLTKDEAAAVRSSLQGRPIVTEEAQPATEREAPLVYGPTVRRLTISNTGDETEFCGQLSDFHREAPDQVEAQRRARAGVPLMGWSPKRVYVK